MKSKVAMKRRQHREVVRFASTTVQKIFIGVIAGIIVAWVVNK